MTPFGLSFHELVDFMKDVGWIIGIVLMLTPKGLRILGIILRTVGEQMFAPTEERIKERIDKLELSNNLLWHAHNLRHAPKIIRKKKGATIDG